MKIIHAADLHIDSPLRGLERYEGAPVDAIRIAPRQALRNLVDLAIEERAEIVLIAGDLYDGDWRDFNTGLFFVNEIARLASAGAHVFIARGNHDAQSVITRSLKLPPNVHVFSADAAETKIVNHLGVAIHGRSFGQRAEYENLAASYPKPAPGLLNVGVLHTSLSGFADHEPYAPCDVVQLVNAGYDYWALGHIHRRTVISESPLIVFPGNLQGRHMRERGAKGCTIVTFDDGLIRGIEHRAVDVVRFSHIAIDSEGVGNVDALLEQIQQSLVAELAASDGRTIAARVAISGEGLAQGCVMKNTDQFVAEIRAQALTIGDGRIWIERLVIETPRARQPDAVLDDASGVSVCDLVDDQVDDAGAKTAIEEQLKQVIHKLPLGLQESLKAELSGSAELGANLLKSRLTERESNL